MKLRTPRFPAASAMDASAASRRAVALFMCLHYLFCNQCGTIARKRRHARQLEDMDEDTALAANFLMSDGYASDSSGWSSEELDELDQFSIVSAGGRCVNSKPRGGDCQLRRWISDPFWFTDPDFKRNMRVSHSTFLRIVELVSASVRDSIHPLTGRVRQTKEFKVAVALYHLGHGGTWRMTANTCAIGISTAKGYVQQVVAAVITYQH